MKCKLWLVRHTLGGYLLAPSVLPTDVYLKRGLHVVFACFIETKCLSHSPPRELAHQSGSPVLRGL